MTTNPYAKSAADGTENFIGIANTAIDAVGSTYYQFNMNMNEHTGMIDLTKTPVMSEPKNHLWKYNEDKILKDVQD